MNLLLTGSREEIWLSDTWRNNGCLVEFVPLSVLVDKLRNRVQDNLTADAIVCVVKLPPQPEEGPVPVLSTEFESAAKFVADVRSLESFYAMRDGRKWNSIPIIVMVSSVFSNFTIEESLNAIVIEIEHPASDLGVIQKVVADYRRKLLDELDNLGLLVSYENGRYRVGPALSPHDRSAEGHLYYGRADQRQGGKYFTIDRDEYGIQFETELFEALINNPNVSEPDLQRFFVEHPHFLSAASLMQAVPMPHVRLQDGSGKILIPDFVMKPIVALQRDSNWEVLDLKLPQAKLLAGPADHRGFSAQVMHAMNQVKDYKDYFENPANAADVQSKLGHRLQHPRLAVLIGRMPPPEEVELLEKAQARDLEVRVVTYDEILEAQRKVKFH
jgi:hypothetical protein